MIIQTKKTAHSPRKMSPERENEMMESARELFFSNGFSATSMDDIARHTGASKATIYRRFNSKEEMFESIVMTSVKKVSEKLNCLTLDINHPIDSIRTSALAIHKVAFDEESINLMRQIIAEAHRLPELSRKARDMYIQNCMQQLTVFFTQLIDKKLMAHDYPEQAAVSFFQLCTGNYRPLLNAVQSKEDERKRMDAELAAFILGCQIKNPY